MSAELVIMAAGIGSRFGGGIKQLEPVGPNGEIIMDYSIHDAIEAGFDKIIFIIRHDIEADFKEAIGDRIEEICEKAGVQVSYAFQCMNDLPKGHTVPEGRKKPWGTGQAVLAAKDVIASPFAVINADDYYGKEAFRKMYAFLNENTDPSAFCMAGFILKNTLSDNGGVTRGVCYVDDNDYLVDVIETRNIVKNVGEDGTVTASNGEYDIDINSHVSMNMWGLTPEFVNMLEDGFVEFLDNDAHVEPLKSEYLLPNIMAKLLCEKKATVKVLETNDKWFGVTYKEDKQYVVNSFKELISNGIYSENLFSDII
jgi:hypothetical protein